MKRQKHKRLILIVNDFPKLSETFIVSKFLGLLETGWDVHIVCNHSERNNWDLFPELKSHPEVKRRVHETWPSQVKWLAGILLPSVFFLTLFKAPLLTFRYLSRAVRLFGWDVFRHFYLDSPIIRLNPVCIHFEFGALAVQRTHLKALLGTKLSVSFRGYSLNFVELENPDYYKDLWQTIDACHVLSDHLRKRAKMRGCPEKIKISVIPPALNIDLFNPPMEKRSSLLGMKEYALRILSVGRLEWKKGYEFALQAVKLLVDEGINCKYRIIGDGSYKSAIYFARYQLELTNIVEFCGAIPHEQVIEQLAWADVFLHPSLSEGFCNAVLEAQAMKLPVISSDSGGLRENVEDGITGFVIPRRNPTAMAEKLAMLAKDGSLRKKMNEAGRMRVIQNFYIQDQILKFNLFYSEIINKS